MRDFCLKLVVYTLTPVPEMSLLKLFFLFSQLRLPIIRTVLSPARV